MRRMGVAWGVALVLAAMVQSAAAADIARLEWGGFVVEDDSSDGWKETKSLSSDDGRSVKLTFEALEAKAEGAMREAASRISGHYDIIQPGVDSFTRVTVALEGHIIKGTTGEAKLTVTVGTAEQTVGWPSGTAASEKFARNLDFAVPGNGRLPNPLTVSLSAEARKEAGGDAVYVSVGSMTIAAENPKVAAR